MNTFSSLRFGLAAILMAATALLLQARSRNEVLPQRQSLNSLPSEFGSWVGRDITIDQQTLDILGPGEFLFRDYEDRNHPLPPVGLFIAYFPSQRAGDTIHSPNHCLPGAGWVPTQRQVVQVARPDGAPFPANRYVISKAGDRQLVLYWYQAHDRAVASEYWAKYYLVADAIRMNRSDGALVRLITPMFRGESPDTAQTRLMNVGSPLLPLLNNYIPR
jgi:EpsI family protein